LRRSRTAAERRFAGFGRRGAARRTPGASEWSEVRLTPSLRRVSSWTPVRARQLTRSRWHLEDHADGDVGGGRATTAMGQGACSRHAYGSLGGEGVFPPEPPPARATQARLRLRARRPGRRSSGSLRWGRARRLVATPAAARRDLPAASGRGSLGSPPSRWRHRPGSRRHLLSTRVAARSSRRCDALVRRTRQLRLRGVAACSDAFTMAMPMVSSPWRGGQRRPEGQPCGDLKAPW
jgi:hypothetical protein